jgi:rubrerythrin
MLEKYSFTDAILLSVARETQSHEYYSLLANAMKNEESAAKIRNLAAVEAVHRRESIKLFKKLVGAEPDISKVVLTPYPEIPRDTANIHEVLKFAADKEKDAYKFYRELASKTDDAQIRKLFLKFSAEELEHCDLLTEEAAALSGQMGSSAIQESSGMEY